MKKAINNWITHTPVLSYFIGILKFFFTLLVIVFAVLMIGVYFQG
jgi:hypothetical protein